MSEPRLISLSLRLTVDEHLWLKKQAKKAHVTQADYMRMALRKPSVSKFPLKDK